MRATDLLIAIGAALGFASADVDLCISPNIESIAEDQFGSIILGLNRTCSDCNSNDCAQQFDSIIKECVTGQELGGGIAITDGMTGEVSIDLSLSEDSKSKALHARRVRKPKSRTETRTKAKTRTKSKKIKSKAKKKKKTKPKTKPKKTKTKPNPKKTKTKPKKTKSKACPIKNKKTPVKKGPKHGLRSFIPTLFTRAGSQQSSSDECEAFDEDMHTPASWGESYFGWTEEIYGTMTTKKLLILAKKA
ncbi:hypothetical protein BU23DRAFT_566297 [Bimuria novae-zelandiae CBS 107.79]|uniref:Uncharacterized protein n=1 Tax=Bimuria novae-zelandiae CBS 107.79 TaxID=1447943 RepID=A0A6A5VHG5_9PLEO|nr:hypothetical protein BU23DRAFT_566297 [Bimuria novae-zelandiae CBS 107.79]